MPRFPLGIMSTCVVPWDEQGEMMEDLFRHQVRESVRGTKNLYVFGTACEGYAVTDRQFDRVTTVFSDEMRKCGAEPMIGVIGLSLLTIIERIARCREAGVKLFQISLPSWGALAESEVFTFFREVCGRFRDCRFLHYNLMRTKRLVTGAEYARLAAEHPNLVATKNSTDSITRVHDLMKQAPDLTHFLDESGYTYASQIGECGLLASVPVINWKFCQEFFDAGQQRDTKRMLELYQEVCDITGGLMQSVNHASFIDGAYDKMLWKFTDRRFPLRLLPPYEYASEESFGKFVSFVEKNYPHWAGK
ncbi:MAG: dihydrodipicolinate synthase family protein [Pirellulales bacterium]